MQVERKDLKAALEAVRPAVASAGSVPELKHVWWDNKYLYAYNGSLGMRVKWEWDLAAGGVLAPVLSGILNSSAAEKVDITATADHLVVKVGKSSTKMVVLQGSANPCPLKTAPGERAQLSVELTPELVEGLRRARVVKATDPTRVEHYGVVLFPSKDFVSLYSTDSKTLVEVQVDGKFSRELNKVVLPHAYVQQLLALDLPAKVHFYSDRIIAENGAVQICSNLMDSSDVWDLPKLASDMVGAVDPNYIKLPAGWAEALNRATALAGSEPANLKLAVVVKAKELIMTGKLAYGSLEEHLPLVGRPTAGSIVVELGQVKALSKGVESFAIAAQALVMNGKDQELLLVAAHDDGRREVRDED